MAPHRLLAYMLTPEQLARFRNSCVRFATTVASGHATLATKRTLPLTCAGLPPAGSHQLAWRTHLITSSARASRVCGRYGISGAHGGVPAGAAAIGLDYRPQRQIETRWATNNPTEIRRHAAELAALAPDVVLAFAALTVGAMLQATRSVPIVFPGVADPVAAVTQRCRLNICCLSGTIHRARALTI
jgi:hypothetical protein